MAFKQDSAFAGAQPINVTSTTQNHPLGTHVRGIDPYYGEAEFVYAAGVVGTVLGDVVVIDTWGAATHRAVSTTAAIGSIGVAMSANVASQYGWYMVLGSALVNAIASASTGKAYISATPGSIDSTHINDNHIFGMNITVQEGASYAGATQVVAQLAYPTCDAVGHTLGSL
jgi:hypothetical protein